MQKQINEIQHKPFVQHQRHKTIDATKWNTTNKRHAKSTTYKDAVKYNMQKSDKINKIPACMPNKSEMQYNIQNSDKISKQNTSMHAK